MDASLYRWVNHLADRTTWAHGFFTLYANAGVVLFALLLLAAFLDARRRHATVEVAGTVWAGVSTFVALGLGQVVGGVIDRARPYGVLQGVHVLVDRTTDVSFPSDHATMAGAVAMGLLLTNRRWGLPAVAAALLMAFTRVYVGAHYPADVVAGLVLGGAVAAAGRFTVPWLDRLVQRMVGTPAAVLVVPRS